jgi:hypothetical protein
LQARGEQRMIFSYRFGAIFQMLVASKPPVLIGDRVRVSTLGALRCARLAGKVGTVVGGSVYTSSVQVRFDGNRCASTLHRDYLDVLANVDPAA